MAAVATYDFDQQKEYGDEGEAALDFAFQSLGYVVRTVTMNEQRLGIDRIFEREGISWSVEYKTDETAANTNRIFIETESVVSQYSEKPGWAKSSLAQRIVTYVPGYSLAFMVNTVSIKDRLPYWLKQYPVKDIPNRGYVTRGIAIPLAQFFRECTPERISVTVIDDEVSA